MAKQYPKSLSDKDVCEYDIIEDATIERDLSDTLGEIERLKKVQAAEAVIADNHLDPNEREMARFKSEARTPQMEERQRFVDFLQLLRSRRKEVRSATPAA